MSQETSAAVVVTPDGEQVPAVLYTASNGLLVTLCSAKKRPPTSRTVHLVPVTGDSSGAFLLGEPLCGVKLGKLQDSLEGAEFFCWGCNGVPKAKQHKTSAEYSQWCADLLALGQVKAYVKYRKDGTAEVTLNVPADLLVGMIKGIPGRVYEPSKKAWIIPSPWADDLIESLTGADVVVRTSADVVPVTAA
jgi:hypothetical protein